MTDRESDRELLELAAKAAGVDPRDYPDDVAHWRWNPLTDDGDALRLAVKLRLCVSVDDDGAMVGYPKGPKDGANMFEEMSDGDACAATRRAIVRAAAEIGRTA